MSRACFPQLRFTEWESNTVSCSPLLIRGFDCLANIEGAQTGDTEGDSEEARQIQEKRNKDNNIKSLKTCFTYLSYLTSPINRECTGYEMSSLNLLMAAGRKDPLNRGTSGHYQLSTVSRRFFSYLCKLLQIAYDNCIFHSGHHSTP